MIVVDDYLTRTIVLGEREEVPDGETVATTWGFHYRLIRALTDNRTSGTLSWGDATEALLAAAQVHDAEVVLTERNVGRRWPGLFDELGLTLTIV